MNQKFLFCIVLFSAHIHSMEIQLTGNKFQEQVEQDAIEHVWKIRQASSVIVHSDRYPNALELLEKLIDEGVSVDSLSDYTGSGLSDMRNRTLLSFAVSYRRREIATILLLKGASVNQLSEGWIHPLYTAIWNGDLKMSKLLMYKSDIDVKNMRGYNEETILHAAADNEINNMSDLIPKLIALGADVNVKNNVGQTALDIAYACKNEKAVEILKEYGAQKSEQN